MEIYAAVVQTFYLRIKYLILCIIHDHTEFQNKQVRPGGVTTKQDMFTQTDDTAKVLADGQDKKYVKKKVHKQLIISIH